MTFQEITPGTLNMDGISAGLQLVEWVPQLGIGVLVFVVMVFMGKQARIDRAECAASILASSKAIVEAIKASSDQNIASHAETREGINAMGVEMSKMREDLVRSSEVARQLDANTKLLSASLASISEIHNDIRAMRDHAIKVDAHVMDLADSVALLKRKKK